MAILEVKNIEKHFGSTQVLKDVSFSMEEGSALAIIGSSGSGKTTMMNIIGILDRPTEGEYMLDGVDVAGAKDKELSKIRNQKIGFVFPI